MNYWPRSWKSPVSPTTSISLTLNGMSNLDNSAQAIRKVLLEIFCLSIIYLTENSNQFCVFVAVEGHFSWFLLEREYENI